MKNDNIDLQSKTVLLVEACLSALDDEGRRPQTTPTEIGESAQIVLDQADGSVPATLFGLGRENFCRVTHQTDKFEETEEGFVGHEPDENTPWDGNKSERQRDTPFPSANSSNLERSTADEDNDNLDNNFYKW
jgi:hypothetical protein